MQYTVTYGYSTIVITALSMLINSVTGFNTTQQLSVDNKYIRNTLHVHVHRQQHINMMTTYTYTLSSYDIEHMN